MSTRNLTSYDPAGENSVGSRSEELSGTVVHRCKVQACRKVGPLQEGGFGRLPATAKWYFRGSGSPEIRIQPHHLLAWGVRSHQGFLQQIDDLREHDDAVSH